MNSRDPRVEPIAGDVLRTTSGEDYLVVQVSAGLVLDTPVDKRHQDFGEVLDNHIKSWRAMMLGAEVIHHAE